MADHDDPVRRGRALALGLAALAGVAGWPRCSSWSTSRSSPRTWSRSAQGGWVPARDRSGRVHPDDDLEARPRAARTQLTAARRVPLRAASSTSSSANAAAARAGTAVFLTPRPRACRPSLLHHLKHNKVLHEQVVLLTVHRRGRAGGGPHGRAASERSRSRPRLLPRPGALRLHGDAGRPGSPRALLRARDRARPQETSYYLGRERLIPTGPRMCKWRKKLFALMSRNARSATEYFRIPPDRVVELGAQIEF